MRSRVLLITTVFSAGLVLNYPTTALSADVITAETVTTATKPITSEELSDPRIAASGFVEHINYARVALAMKDNVLAKQHLEKARKLMSLIKDSTVESRRITDVETGRIVYEESAEYKYYYFPIEVGPVQVKEVSNGPAWAYNQLAVTDADIVYLTLDLTGEDAEKHLAEAEEAINADNFKEADKHLAALTNAVVKIDSQASVPSDKARDNIALARSFIAGKNYGGASFALKHADKAFDEMQINDGYKPYRESIISMRQEIADLQGYLANEDPEQIRGADIKMQKLWEELKSWTTKEQ